MPKRDLHKEPPPADAMPNTIKRDPDRDLRDVPGSYNPGNQAGKGSDHGDGAQEPPRKTGPDRQKDKPEPEQGRRLSRFCLASENLEPKPVAFLFP